jgi:DNA-directed RNA polymerase specialized sigma24 family protein
MDWVRHGVSKREFDCFVAEAWERLLRTGYLMTGDARDAEDLVQETLLKVARRWNRVDGGTEAADENAARALREIDDQAEFRWALTQLPVAEVADILGCSEGTVTSTASRAAARLAEALAHNAPPATQTRMKGTI